MCAPLHGGHKQIGELYAHRLQWIMEIMRLPPRRIGGEMGCLHAPGRSRDRPPMYLVACPTGVAPPSIWRSHGHTSAVDGWHLVEEHCISRATSVLPSAGHHLAYPLYLFICAWKVPKPYYINVPTHAVDATQPCPCSSKPHFKKTISYYFGFHFKRFGTRHSFF